MENYINSMLAGSAMNIVSASYLVCLFAIAILKPYCIRKRLLFRTACIVFALSFVLPVIPSLMATNDIGRYMVRESRAVSMLLTSSGSLLLGLSLILAFSSLALEEKKAS